MDKTKAIDYCVTKILDHIEPEDLERSAVKEVLEGVILKGFSDFEVGAQYCMLNFLEIMKVENRSDGQQVRSWVVNCKKFINKPKSVFSVTV